MVELYFKLKIICWFIGVCFACPVAIMQIGQLLELLRDEKPKSKKRKG